jgi:hypothetical protein
VYCYWIMVTMARSLIYGQCICYSMTGMPLPLADNRIILGCLVACLLG